MKKATFFLFHTIFFLVGVEAQVDNENYIDKQETIRQLAILSPISPGARGFDNRYEGVKGSPFLFEDWKKARVVVQGGDAEGVQVEINIDQYDNLLAVKFSSGQTGTVPASKIRMLYVETLAGARTFESLSPTVVESGRDEGARFYEVLHRGQFILLKNHEKVFQKANYQGAYSPDRRFDEYLDRQSYYMRGPNGPFEKINKLKSKAIEKALAGYEKRIGQIVEEEKLDLREEKDLIQLIQMLEN